LLLGWIGQKPVETPYIEIGMVGTFFYFFFLLILLPLIGFIEQYLIKYNSTPVISKDHKTEFVSEILNYAVLKKSEEFSFFSFGYLVMLIKRIKLFW
jgi:hypothetical protein